MRLTSPRMRVFRTVQAATFVVIALIVLAPAPSHAQSASEVAAQALHSEGRLLLSEGRPAEAAESFDLSLRRVDAPFTRAYLALALARSGQCTRVRDLAGGIRADAVPAERADEMAAALKEASDRCPVASGGSGGSGESAIASADAPSRRDIDPGDDRVMTTPSAGTLRKGRMSFSDYELGLAQFSYGITDDLQFSVAMTVPVMQIGVIPTLKWRFLDTGRFRMAAIAGGGLGVFYTGPDVLIAGGGGGFMGDACVGAGCDSFLSFGAQVIGGHIGGTRDEYGSGDWVNDKVIGVTSNLGAVVAVHAKVKLLFELKYTMGKMLDEWTDSGSLFALNYGIRVHGEQFAADIGFSRPFLALDGSRPEDVEEFMKYLPIGYPWLAFTYQW